MTKLSIGQSTHLSQHFGLLMVVLKASSSKGVIIMSARRREMWDPEGESSPYQYNSPWCKKYSAGTVFY